MARFALYDDIREALRRVRRNLRTSLLAIGTLALGIGASTAVFTMAHAALLAPPPYRDPDRIVSLHAVRKDQQYIGISGADFLDFRKQAGLFEASALVDYGEFSWTGQSLPGFDGAEVLRGLIVTADYFRVLDRPMAAGRGFAPDEDHEGHDLVTVLSYGLWQRRFGGQPDIIGQTVTFNGRVRTVVGVAGRNFLPYQLYEVQAWIPIHNLGPRDSFQFDCVARLAAPKNQAQSRLNALAAHLAEAYPDSHRGYSIAIQPLLAELRSNAKPAMYALAGAVACLLLIAAANVAGLLLARATAQAREMAIRVALGAGRIRLYRMMIAESLILALSAGILGALVSAWLLSGAKALMPPTYQLGWMFTFDRRVFAIAFLVSTFAGLAAGLAPALQSFRLAAGGLRPSFGRSRLLRGIVTAEIALASLLLVATGLLGRSFAGLLHRPLGYATDHVLGMRVRLIGERYKETGQVAAYWSQLVERAGAIPGVAKAASVSDLPMGWQYSGGPCEARGTAGADVHLQCHYIMASPGYFATIGIAMLRGRAFSEADGPKSEPVVIVSDLLAETAWPGRDPIGQQVKLPWEDWRRVIGVVRRIRHGGPDDDYENSVYMPYRQENESTMFLVLRTHVPPEAVIPAVRATIAALDPNSPAFEIRSMEKAFDREISMPRLPVVLTSTFATLAALMAGLGLFGVIAYWVSQRTREIGIRAALGADSGELRGMVLRQGAKLAVAGLAAGLLAALAVARFLHSLLYGMSERDPLVYAGAILVAGITVLLACWLPAARASRIDPAAALREE